MTIWKHTLGLLVITSFLALVTISIAEGKTYFTIIRQYRNWCGIFTTESYEYNLCKPFKNLSVDWLNHDTVDIDGTEMDEGDDYYNGNDGKPSKRRHNIY